MCGGVWNSLRQFWRCRVPVKWKLFCYFLIFSLVLLLLLWLFQVVFLNIAYQKIRIGAVKRDAAALAACVDEENFGERVRELAYRSQSCVLVYRIRENGYISEELSAETLKTCVIHNISLRDKFRLYSDACAEEDGILLTRFRLSPDHIHFYSVTDETEDIKGEESVVCTAVTKTGSGETVFLMLNTVITPVGTTISTLRRLLVMISVFSLISAIVLAIVLSRHISRPIVQLNASTKVLATGRYDADFHVQGYREIAELSSSLQYAASELSKVDSLRRELLANISHDLRTPLTMIVGYAEAMQDIPGENTPENLQIIIDEANRLSSLVNDVLDISKLESGAQVTENSVFSVTEAVAGLCERYGKLCAGQGYTITFEADRDVTVETDRIRFTQVIYNIVNNAINYAGADRCVLIRQKTDPAGGRVRISVTDHGEGIPEDKLPYIWDRYYKVDKVHRRSTVGTGLGLCIVRETMELLGGSYGVISSPGGGSTFWVELPVLDDTGNLPAVGTSVPENR